MTKHIYQRNNNDCMLACIAMAAEKDYDALWTAEDVKAIVKSHGATINDTTELLERAGFHPYVNGEVGKIVWRLQFAESLQRDETVRHMLKGRKAILSVPSLNHMGGWHVVYWDGGALYDPNNPANGKQYYQWLDQLSIRTVWIFDERQPESK